MKMKAKTQKVMKVILGLVMIIGVFLISGCIREECGCGEWGSPKFVVYWDGQSEEIESVDEEVSLGTISPSTEITIEANYNCIPCEATYEWYITSTPGTEQSTGSSPLTYSPQGGWQEGNYFVTVKAFCGTNYCSLYHFKLIVINISEGKPDLIVDNVVFDEDCNATFTICNIGNADVIGNFPFIASPIEHPSGQTTVWSADIFGLAAGGCITQEWLDVRALASTIVVIVDPQNSVDESDETNNENSFLVPAVCQEVCACLYSGMDGMEMLLDENWDGNNPDAGSWVPVNVIPQGDANASDWGVRFPDLPWSFMYDNCADWVYGNNDWMNPPASYDHEYYRLPFTVPISGNCVYLGFQAYIDDGAKFYIYGPGFSSPTLFYEHDSDDSMDNHDPVEFWVDPNAPTPICLGPGDYTIYIDHVDTAGVIYGLIFTAECVSCGCPCQCGDWNDTNNDGTPDVTVEGNVVNIMGTINVATADFPVTIEPGYQCQGSNCTVTYGWQVVGPNASSGGPIPAPIELTQQELNGPGEYTVNLEVYCDGQECTGDDFKFKIVVEHSVTLTVGICDNFNLPTEATSPSQALIGWISENYHTPSELGHSNLRDCDEGGVDRYWAHTFTGLEPLAGCHIVSATLEITVKNNDIINENDELLIGFIGDAGDSWDFTAPLSDWVAVGTVGTITLNLGNVGGNLLDIMELGFLDVAVQDDSPVDCVILHVTYGP